MSQSRPSFWEQDITPNKYDFVIIGAGFTGLYTAIRLKSELPKATILVVEQSSFAQGASSRNAGFLCMGSPSEILDNIKSIGESLVHDLLVRRWKGLQWITSLFAPYEIELSHSGGSEVFFERDQHTYELCMQNLTYLNQLFESATGKSNAYKISSSEPGSQIDSSLEYLLHPGKLLLQLHKIARQQDIQFSFRTTVNEIIEQDSGALLHCGDLNIQTDLAIVCCNAFTTDLLPETGIVPARNIVLLSTPSPEYYHLDRAFHYDKGYMYWRKVGNRLLIGGARNLDMETETTSEFGYNEMIVEHLVRFSQKELNFSSFQIEQSWSGILGFTPTSVPLVDFQSKHVLVCAGMNGMGVAISAQIGAEVVSLLN